MQDSGLQVTPEGGERGKISGRYELANLASNVRRSKRRHAVERNKNIEAP